MGIFDLNENVSVIEEDFLGSKIYYIDNFYKYPDNVVDTINKSNCFFHRSDSEDKYKSLNGIFFHDRRNMIITDEVKPVYDYLSKMCDRQVCDSKNNIILTNRFKFCKCDFNNYDNSYWYPHTDPGYTGIIYLNKDDDMSGTNLYENIIPDQDDMCKGEHVFPWRPKNKWKLLKYLKSKYNRCILFDGKMFTHGMSISDDRYSYSEDRLTQVLFFKDEYGSCDEYTSYVNRLKD